jgi:hypothetical protein
LTAEASPVAAVPSPIPFRNPRLETAGFMGALEFSDMVAFLLVIEEWSRLRTSSIGLVHNDSAMIPLHWIVGLKTFVFCNTRKIPAQEILDEFPASGIGFFL